MADRFDTSKDPRFKRVPRHVRKVKVDDRFAHMFKDKRFVETPKVDAQGRKLRKDTGKKKLRDFYALEEDGSAGEEAAEELQEDAVPPASGEKKKKKKNVGKKAVGAHVSEADEDEAEVEADDDAEEDEEEDDDEDDEDDEDEEEEDEDDDDDAVEEAERALWSKNEASVPRGDASKRLAVMGCDWDHVAAADLLTMFRTFLSSKESMKNATTLRATASVDKVVVYPSDFGLQQMAKEATSGPQLPEVPGGRAVGGKAAGEDEEDETVQSEALRLYQLQRTKYYWALVECDSLATASWLYDQMDGLEADGIAPAGLDLRFVPDELVPPHPPAGQATDIPKKYSAPQQLKSATGHSRVKCTWDEAPQQRRKDLMKKKFTAKEMMEMDLSAYLASSSGEEEPADIEALKQLARGGGDDDSDFFDSGGSGDEEAKPELGDMEATFSTKATELEEELLERTKRKGGKGVHTLESTEPKTVWEKYLDKKKEKRRERRKKAKEDRKARRDGRPAAEGGSDTGDDGDADDCAADSAAGATADRDDLELLAGGADGDDRGFNMRGPQRAAHRGQKMTKKRKRALEAGEADPAVDGNFKVDTSDPRIAAVFSSADFEIDPTNPEFRRTDGMGAVLQKKRQRKLRAGSAPVAAAAAAAATPVAAASAATAVPRANGAKAGVGLGGLQLFAGKRREGGEQVAAAHGGGSVATAGAAAADGEEAAAGGRKKLRPAKRKARE